MIYLAQTDTTAGFLSKDEKEINKAKKRDLNTPCILTMAYFAELLCFVRVPKVHKNLVRRARKTSFIYSKKFTNLNKTRLDALSKPSSFNEAALKNEINLASLKSKGLNLNKNSSSLACRVVKDCVHCEFLRKNGAFFSSSANLHKEEFSEERARKIVLEICGKIIDEDLFEGVASKLILLSRMKKRRLR